MRENSPRAVNWFSWFTLGATLVLICAGGLVTSKGVGMAVPDWPNTYGYNMFFFPVSKWVGGIFYEHLHRLIASSVGLLTIVLAVALWRKERRRWVRALGVAAVLAVILQGVLGGLRVVLDRNQIGIFHALLAQLFFLLIGSIAIVTSRWWPPVSPGVRPSPAAPAWPGVVSPKSQRRGNGEIAAAGDGRTPILRVYALKPFGYLYFFGTLLIFAQLWLGATMRHQHAGLAVPDFPRAYGRWWPPTDDASLQVINQHRVGVYDQVPLTAAHIRLHMAHRISALVILATTMAAAWITRRRFGPSHFLSRLAFAWIILIVAQVFLGAATVWTGKSADIATAHVATGALALLIGFTLTLLTFGLAVNRAENYGTRKAAAAVSFSLNPNLTA